MQEGTAAGAVYHRSLQPHPQVFLFLSTFTPCKHSFPIGHRPQVPTPSCLSCPAPSCIISPHRLPSRLSTVNAPLCPPPGPEADAFLSELPRALVEDVKWSAHSSAFSRLPLFAGCEEPFMAALQVGKCMVMGRCGSMIGCEGACVWVNECHETRGALQGSAAGGGRGRGLVGVPLCTVMWDVSSMHVSATKAQGCEEQLMAALQVGAG